MAAPNLDNLSEELTSLPQFCVRYEKQPFIKTPKTGKLTASWAGVDGKWAGHEGYLTFAEARKLLEDAAKVRVNIDGKWVDRPITGIGFMNMRAADPARQIVGGDIDCCRNPDTGNIGKWAYSFLHRIQTFYVEVSPSKTGIRFFALGHLPNDVDSVTGHGAQDDLPASDREAILAAKPGAREKIAKGKPAFNGVELYVDSRHLTLTGDKLATYCCPPEDCTAAIAEALRDYLGDPADEQPIQKKKSTKKAGSFPPLDILQVIDTTGFEERGGQLSGPHPTEGSTTGANLVVNPGKGVWAYMHDKPAGSAPGGDAWVWLACECGAVSWEVAGAGVLKDPVVVAKTMMRAAKRGLIPETDDIVAAYRQVTETEAEMHRREHAEANPPWLRADADKFEADHPGCKIYNCDDDPKPHQVSPEDAEKERVFHPKLEVYLEPDNFISLYREYAATTSDAYPEYHYGSALELASVAADRNVVIEHKHGDIYTNMWIFGLGDSTISRKTTAHKLCRLLAKSKFPLKCLPSSFSPESLMEAISVTPQCYYMKDEAGSLLASLCKDYMKETQDFLSEIYECDDYHRKLKKSEYHIVDPYMSQYLMTTPDNLKEYTTPLNLTSGWLLRYMWMYPNYIKEWKPFAEKEAADFDRFAAITAAYNKVAERLTTKRRLRLSPESMEYFDIWHKDLEVTAMVNASNIEKALAGRLATYALKIAALMTVCRADYTETSMIELPHIKEACRQIVEYFLPIGIIVVEEVARAESKNIQDKIMGTLKRNNGLIKHSILLRALHLTIKEVDAAIEALVQSEEIERITVKDVVYYRKIKYHSEIVSHQIVYKGKEEELYKSKEDNTIYTPLCATNHFATSCEGEKCKDATITEDVRSVVVGAKVEKKDEDPEIVRIRAGHQAHVAKKKRTCAMCGAHFDYDLGIRWQGGYICEPCRRDGPPPEPTKPESQTRLGEVVA